MNKCTSWNIVSSREKKANIRFVMYCIKINFTLVQVYFPFTRKGKGYENEFKLQKKKYTEISATYAFSTESFHTENYGVHGLLTQATIV